MDIQEFSKHVKNFMQPGLSDSDASIKLLHSIVGNTRDVKDLLNEHYFYGVPWDKEALALKLGDKEALALKLGDCFFYVAAFILYHQDLSVVEFMEKFEAPMEEAKEFSNFFAFADFRAFQDSKRTSMKETSILLTSEVESLSESFLLTTLPHPNGWPMCINNILFCLLVIANYVGLSYEDIFDMNAAKLRKL
jgi:NTP pyrophosphatase (non-canonical NTP hydrolase)